MMKKQMLAVLGLIACWYGCTLAPEYTRPEAPIPAEWPKGEAYKNTEMPAGAVKIPELSRKEFFRDSKLQKIITLALDNNRDLRLAALNVERVRALYGVQRSELFPVVNAVGTFSKQRNSEDLITPGDPRIREQYGLNLGIAAWELDFFGRIRSLSDQALSTYLATEEARRSAEIALVAEVGRVYLTLAADRENLKIAGATLADRQAAYALIQKQYEVGLAAKLDLRRAQTQVDVAREDLARFTQLSAQEQNALNLLAGGPVAEELLPPDLSSLSPTKAVFAELPSAALLNRPDILAAEHRLKGAYAFIGAARAAFFPRISLTTSIGTASDKLSGLFGAGTDTWTFAPQIVMPIFDARTWAAFRVSKAEQDIALTQYEKAIQTAFREVADTLAVQGTVDKQIAAHESLIEAVAETHDLSKKRYEKGLDSYLSVLDSQRSLYAAQQGLVGLRLTRLASQIRLYAVLGGGAE